jgi:ADP-ribose pyrophosphatase YjhB (NUDIX family)
MQPPVVWMERGGDFRKTWTRSPRLPAGEYGRCIAAFPRICADVLPVEPKTKGFYLGKRIQHSAKGRWPFGGGAQRRGLTTAESAAEKCYLESGIRVKPHELIFLFAFESFWECRDVEPQELGEHCMTYTYCFVPTAKEIQEIKLDPTQFDLDHGVQLYTRGQMERFEESTRELLLLYWDAAFGE